MTAAGTGVLTHINNVSPSREVGPGRLDADGMRGVSHHFSGMASALICINVRVEAQSMFCRS